MKEQLGSALVRPASAERTADLVIIGFGAAGAAAACEAAAHGLDVLVVEKAPEALAGGTSRVSSHGFLSPRAMQPTADYIRALAKPHVLAPGRATVWAHLCCQNGLWLESLGIETRELSGLKAGAEYPELPGSWAVAKRRVAAHHGSLWSALSSTARERSVEVLYGARATRLLRADGGRVAGIECATQEGLSLSVGARKGVLICTGGFGSSKIHLKRFAGSLGEVRTAGSPYSTGDGIELAGSVGARMSGLGAVSGPYLDFDPPGFRGTVPLDPMLTNITFAGQHKVTLAQGQPLDLEVDNRHGRVRRGRNWVYEPLPARALFLVNRAALDFGPLVSGPDRSTGWPRVVEGLRWSSDNTLEAAHGWIEPVVETRTLKNAGLDPSDDWSALALVPSILNTQGGPERDALGRLSTPDGQPIPGLFAAGELGSIFPNLYQGAGNLADCLVSARLAVRTAIGRTWKD